MESGILYFAIKSIGQDTMTVIRNLLHFLDWFDCMNDTETLPSEDDFHGTDVLFSQINFYSKYTCISVQRVTQRGLSEKFPIGLLSPLSLVYASLHLSLNSCLSALLPVVPMWIHFHLCCILLYCMRWEQPCNSRYWVLCVGWMNRCSGYTEKATHMGIPSSWFLLPAHRLPALPQGKRQISIFLSFFPAYAPLTSVLFQWVCKNKYPARSCVQNSVRCQNKFIPLSFFQGNSKPKMTFQFPFAKMH